MEPMEPMAASYTIEHAILYKDLDALDTFFALPHVQREVRETDAYIADTRPRDAVTCTRHDGSRPWFRRAARLDRDHCTIALEMATVRGDAHVLDWFFSRERAVWMPATLALLLRYLVLVNDKRVEHFSHLKNAMAVIEVLLSSHVFLYVLSDDDQQRLLDDIATYSRSEAYVHAAIAHGARVDRPETVAALVLCAYQQYYAVFYRLLDAGLTLVGADVLPFVAQTASVEWIAPLIECGVDWGNDTSKPLIVLATSLSRMWEYDDLTRFVRYAGFQDLDQRGEHGETPLMVAAECVELVRDDANKIEQDPADDLVQFLVWFGADADAVDDDGRTVWDYARRAGNERLIPAAERIGLVTQSNGSFFPTFKSRYTDTESPER